MLGLLKQYLWRRRRLIFRFNDGTRVCAVDPIEISSAIHSHPVYLPQHLGEAKDGHIESQAIVANAACDVFGVSRFDGYKNGMTVAERIELMMAFDMYMDILKKNIAPSQIRQHSTESTSPRSGEPTTKPMSESGSTATDPCLEKQTSSKLESTPPIAS